MNWLYEQKIKKKATSLEMALVLGNYPKSWQCWCTTGLARFKHDVYDASLINLIRQGQTLRLQVG
jgi:hypothetical protein